MTERGGRSTADRQPGGERMRPRRPRRDAAAPFDAAGLALSPEALLRGSREAGNGTAAEPLVARRLLQLQATHGNQHVQRLLTRGDGKVGRQVRREAAAVKSTKGKVEEFTPEIIDVDEPKDFEKEVDAFVKHVIRVLMLARTEFLTATLNFGNTMFQKSAKRKPDVLGAVLNEAVDMAFGKLVSTAGASLPGIGEIVALAGAAKNEIASAAGEGKDADLVKFIRAATTKAMGSTKKMIESLEKTDKQVQIRNALRLKAKGKHGYTIVLAGLKATRDKLAAPNAKQIEQTLYEAWMRRSTKRTTGGLFGTSMMDTGVLFFEYAVNADATKADLKRVVLVEPTAPHKLVAGLKATMGSKINPNKLNFTRAVHLEKDRFRKYTVHFGPGKAPDAKPRGDIYGYFGKLVKTLPTVDLDKVETAKSVFAR